MQTAQRRIVEVVQGLSREMKIVFIFGEAFTFNDLHCVFEWFVYVFVELGLVALPRGRRTGQMLFRF